MNKISLTYVHYIQIFFIRGIALLPNVIACLKIVLRGKGLEVEVLEFWEGDEVLEFIRCCCATATAIDGSIHPLNEIVVIIATVHRIACERKSFSHWVMLRFIHQIYSYVSNHTNCS